jgi:hypothetical protein
MNKRILLTAAAVVAASAYALPSQAAPKDKDPYVTPTEAGCFDILASGTTGNLTRVVKSVQQDTINATLGLYGPYSVTYDTRGIVDGTLQLSAATCAEAVYVLTVSDPTGAVVDRVTATGAPGSTSVVFEEVVPTSDAAGRVCVSTVYTVEDRFGNVIDASPDAGSVEVCDDGTAGSYTN